MQASGLLPKVIDKDNSTLHPAVGQITMIFYDMMIAQNKLVASIILEKSGTRYNVNEKERSGTT